MSPIARTLRGMSMDGMGSGISREAQEAVRRELGRDPAVRAMLAHKDAGHAIEHVLIGYRLTIAGPPVELARSELDPALPPLSYRITAGDHALVVVSAEWEGRAGELGEHVRAWVLEHVSLRGTRLRARRGRVDPVWRAAWRDANPWA